MTPKHKAIAYRIWAECQQNGWDRTVGDVAKAVGVTSQLAGLVIKDKGWRERFRNTLQDNHRFEEDLTPRTLSRNQLRDYGVNI